MTISTSLFSTADRSQSHIDLLSGIRAVTSGNDSQPSIVTVGPTLVSLFEQCRNHTKTDLDLAAFALQAMLKGNPAYSASGTFKHAVVQRLVASIASQPAPNQTATDCTKIILDAMDGEIPMGALTYACTRADIHRKIPAPDRIEVPLEPQARLRTLRFSAEEAELIVRYFTYEAKITDRKDPKKVGVWVDKFIEEFLKRAELVVELRAALQACIHHPLSYLVMKRIIHILKAVDGNGNVIVLPYKLRELSQLQTPILPQRAQDSLPVLMKGTQWTAYLADPILSVHTAQTLRDLQRIQDGDCAEAIFKVQDALGDSITHFLDGGRLTVMSACAPFQTAVRSQQFDSLLMFMQGHDSRGIAFQPLDAGNFERARAKIAAIADHCEVAYYDPQARTLVMSEPDRKHLQRDLSQRAIALAHEWTHIRAPRKNVAMMEATAGLVEGLMEVICEGYDVLQLARYLGMTPTEFFIARRVPGFFSTSA